MVDDEVQLLLAVTNDLMTIKFQSHLKASTGIDSRVSMVIFLNFLYSNILQMKARLLKGLST